jgi:large subunit ribosomal protein L23
MQHIDVLLSPVISEKAVRLAQSNQYLFLVAADATKGEIKKAVEQHYKVEVQTVQTAQYRTSPRRQTRKRIENAGIFKKKAYVTLKNNQTLSLLEAGE